jgi:hypothetical protein
MDLADLEDDPDFWNMSIYDEEDGKIDPKNTADAPSSVQSQLPGLALTVNPVHREYSQGQLDHSPPTNSRQGSGRLGSCLTFRPSPAPEAC